MKMGFLDALSVVALGVREAKEALFQKVAVVCQARNIFMKPRVWFAYSSSFQKLNPMFCRPWVSETPAMPSSPHLNARDRACSCGKSAGGGQRELPDKANAGVYIRLQASPSGL